MVNRQEVMKTLKECYDLEIPINVVDLGLIYGLSIKSGKVAIEMTLTSVGCPLAGAIKEQIMEKVANVKGVKAVDVKIVFDPPWSPERMTAKARKQFGL